MVKDICCQPLSGQTAASVSCGLVCTGASIGATHPTSVCISHTIVCIGVIQTLTVYVPIVCTLMYVLYSVIVCTVLCTYIPRGCLNSQHVQFIHKCV